MELQLKIKSLEYPEGTGPKFASGSWKESSKWIGLESLIKPYNQGTQFYGPPEYV